MEKRDRSTVRALMLTAAVCLSFLAFSVVSAGSPLATAQTVTVSADGISPRQAATTVQLMASPADQLGPGIQATPGSGPEIKTQSEADAAQNKRKIVAGVLAAVLLGAVIGGRHLRKKRSKAEG